MAIHKLEKTAWRSYLDEISKSLTGKRAEIEIDSLGIGAQIEAKWLPLLGVVYDPKSDLVEIALEGVDHLIREPRELYVDYHADGLRSLEIIDAGGAHQIVQLRDPLMLPQKPSG
jgi:hypothetical protein